MLCYQVKYKVSKNLNHLFSSLISQAFVFYDLLDNPKKRLAKAMKIRESDGMSFKFIGLSRTDQKGLAIEDILTVS